MSFFSLIEPYYRPSFRLFCPITSVFLIFFYIGRKCSKSQLFKVEKVRKVLDNKAEKCPNVVLNRRYTPNPPLPQTPQKSKFPSNRALLPATFLTFYADNKGDFERCLIYFGIFLPYYRVLFRLF